MGAIWTKSKDNELEGNQTEPLPSDQAWEALLSTLENEIFLNYETKKAKQFTDNPPKQ